MIFTLSKIFWLLAAPANLMGLCLLLAGAGRLLKWWKFSDFFFYIGMTLFVVFGVFPTGPSLVAWLETQHSRPADLPDKVKGIIVLGGAFDTRLSYIYGVPVLNDGVERVLDGAMLTRYYADSTLLFSGGSGRLTNRERTEAADAADFLRHFPDIKDRVIYEDRSRNTWQNAAYSYELAKPQKGEKWILVTSAYHMPRANMMFRQAGWPELIPWPTDFRSDGEIDLIPRKFDILGNFYQSHVAVKEIIGQFVYKTRLKYGI